MLATVTAQATVRQPASRAVAIDRVASIIVDALERVWSGIRRRHPGVPAAVVIVGPGDNGKRRIWGHFAPDRWKRGRSIVAESATEHVHEVMLSGESLERDPAATLGTMLHEAAHALAEASDIKDTSRKGRYHNGRYKKLAEKLGLDVAKDPKIGWSLTTIRPATVVEYAAEMELLREAQELTRQARRCWAEEEESKARKRRYWECGCREPRKLTMSKKDSERGKTICTECESEFVEVVDDDA